MKLDEFLQNHLLAKIGETPPNYLYTEIIVDDPEELISAVEQSDCYISSIRWWDRAQIEFGSKIGYGGPRDPRTPNTHFFAETDMEKNFGVHTTTAEYYQYLSHVRMSYADFDLLPSFDIAFR